MATSPELLVRPDVEATLTPDELAWVEKVIDRLYDALGCSPETEATIVLTDDEEIRGLNAEWRGVDEVTDVLSFAYQEAMDSDLTPELLGDVIISIPTARRYAEDAKHAEWIGEDEHPVSPWNFQFELAFLVSHGFLHLLGFDHEEPEEKAEMRRAEREVFEALIATERRPPRAESLICYEDDLDA